MFSYIGFVLGTIYQYGLLKIMISVVFKDVDGVPDYKFNIPGYIITLVSFLVFYELIMYFYSKRIKKISIKEIMLSEG